MSAFRQIEMSPLVYVRPSLLVFQTDSGAGDVSEPRVSISMRELDKIAKNHPEKTESLNFIGVYSRFHETHGYYADPLHRRRLFSRRLIACAGP